MNILALDLGTRTGYAIFCDGQIKTSGTKKLSKKTFGSRFSEFRCWLIETICKNQIDVVCFERVYRHAGTEAAHVYGGFMYTLAAVCDELSVSCEGFSVGSIKKFMTGKGNANKEEMIAAAIRQGLNPSDDNEADALAILLLSISVNYLKPLGQREKSVRVLSGRQKMRSPAPRHLASVRSFSEVDERDVRSKNFAPLREDLI